MSAAADAGVAASGRIALGIEYDGAPYQGWQQQPHGPSIQASLNAAASAVANEPVHCIAAGRTDAGVHATGQVVHFDTQAARSPREWRLGINSNLPESIAVQWVRAVPDGFHARFSARGRSYRYLILERPAPSPLWAGRAWWLHAALDSEAMHAAAQCIVGTHDFSAFRAAGCQSHSPVREVREISVRRWRDFVVLDIAADAFLHHMVRNITGTLTRVGRGEAAAAWVAEVLAGRDRRRAGITAPPQGLCLVAVDYPARYGAPPPPPPYTG